MYTESWNSGLDDRVLIYQHYLRYITSIYFKTGGWDNLCLQQSNCTIRQWEECKVHSTERVKPVKLLVIAKQKEATSILLVFACINLLTGVGRFDRSSGLAELDVLTLILVPLLPLPDTISFRWFVMCLWDIDIKLSSAAIVSPLLVSLWFVYKTVKMPLS